MDDAYRSRVSGLRLAGSFAGPRWRYISWVRWSRLVSMALVACYALAIVSWLPDEPAEPRSKRAV